MSRPSDAVDPVRPSFFEWLDQQYGAKFTGPVLIHFGQGVVHSVQILTPESTLRLDNRRNKA